MIRKTLYKFLRWVGSYDQERRDREIYSGTAIAGNSVRAREDVEVDGLRFNVMTARGGTVVQLRKYDSRKDENKYTTYVIPDGENIAEEIGKIVSMELLTQ
jgi:hypothetical protein